MSVSRQDPLVAARHDISSWDRRFMDLAVHIGTWSKDRSRKVGCVIVGPGNEIRSTGYNGFARGVRDDIEERHNRPDKYLWTEHAERNAIYNAARLGVSLDGCRMYLPWFPCVDCARAIVQCGIAQLCAIEPDLQDERWGDHFRVALEMLSEAGISVRWVNE
ncbi:MAG: dCMP deaminase family protein [Bryobacterales bacterium]